MGMAGPIGGFQPQEARRYRRRFRRFLAPVLRPLYRPKIARSVSGSSFRPARPAGVAVHQPPRSQSSCQARPPIADRQMWQPRGLVRTGPTARCSNLVLDIQLPRVPDVALRIPDRGSPGC